MGDGRSGADGGIGTRESAPQARLLRALAAWLAEDDIDPESLTIDRVARNAGVSRATAYRHFGDREGLFAQAADVLTSRHHEHSIALIASRPTAMDKLEEAWAYGARELPRARRLFRSVRTPWIRDALWMSTRKVVGPVVHEGQKAGELRDDLSLDEIVAWLNSQMTILFVLQPDDLAARRWFRTFMAPVIEPRRGDRAETSDTELRIALRSVRDSLHSLADGVTAIDVALSGQGPSSGDH